MTNHPLTWRQCSSVLALAASALILVVTVSLSLIWPAPAFPTTVLVEEPVESANMTALCPTCHPDQAADEWHDSHVSVGLRCTSCHLARPELTTWEGAKHPFMTADHAFEGATVPCAGCHL